MANYITIDGGTTNTRVSLVKDGEIKEILKYNVGARAGIDDATLLRVTVKNAISKLLLNNNMKEKDITRILASGMITSEFGLYKLDHAVTPVGIEELHNTMKEVVLDDISESFDYKNKYAIIEYISDISEYRDSNDEKLFIASGKKRYKK